MCPRHSRRLSSRPPLCLSTCSAVCVWQIGIASAICKPFVRSIYILIVRVCKRYTRDTAFVGRGKKNNGGVGWSEAKQTPINSTTTCVLFFNP